MAATPISRDLNEISIRRASEEAREGGRRPRGEGGRREEAREGSLRASEREARATPPPKPEDRPGFQLDLDEMWAAEDRKKAEVQPPLPLDIKQVFPSVFGSSLTCATARHHAHGPARATPCPRR